MAEIMNFENLFDLKNKVILIVGAAAGLAEDTCLGIGQFGANIILADMDAFGLERVAKRMGDMKMSALCQVVDITQINSIENLMEIIQKKFGRLDVIINFAGIGWRKPIESIGYDEFYEIINVNLIGSFLLVKYGLPLMLPQRSGKIILVGSVSGQIGRANMAHYAASKGGIHAMVRTMAVELAQKNIQINAIAPAFTLTPQSANTLSDPEVKKTILSTIPMNRLGLPSDLVGMMVLLAGKGSDFITGQTIFIDGGCTIS